MLSGYVDYHNHTVLCHHATGTPREYLERARQLGLREFGFSEHSPWMVRADPRNLCPSAWEAERYLRWMDELRAEFSGSNGGPTLRVGLEADWVPDRLDEARAFIAAYPFDYVHGSVHHITDPGSGQWISAWWFPTQDVEAVYRTYFDAVADLARSGLCDILSHLDVVRRSMRLPPGGVVPQVERILPAIVESGCAVEINSSGKDHPNGDFFPCREVLALLVEAGVPITFGSDGHAVEHVGRYREEVIACLRSCGGREFVRFEQRRKIPTPLD
ncbi:histidinol-phosphatase [Candidatus Poribacteria bacterium]|nr:histidinol-phosphatase [Candidatus Poribacteria bacterium]